MGQQRREPLLSPCKEKGKETMDQKLCMQSWVLGQEHGGAARTQQAAEHAMCHSRQDQSRILWDMAEQVCVPGQAGNTRARLLGRWRAAPASLACKWPLWTEIVENRNTQTWARQARCRKYRWINLQGREKEKHRDMLHTSQLFSNRTAVCHHRDKWMGNCALLDASYCCFMPLQFSLASKPPWLGVLFMFYVPSAVLLARARTFLLLL